MKDTQEELPSVAERVSTLSDWSSQSEETSSTHQRLDLQQRQLSTCPVSQLELSCISAVRWLWYSRCQGESKE